MNWQKSTLTGIVEHTKDRIIFSVNDGGFEYIPVHYCDAITER